MNNNWNELLEYESRDLIQRFYTKRFGRKPSDDKVPQIAANFIQAREYFKNAENASITVRPLLQYYGVMALSKGLILCLDANLTEAQLKASHGLDIKNWKLILSNREFEKLEITVGNGTFSELMRATENKNYLRANSSAVSWGGALNIPPAGTVVTLKQLIQYFPDLSREYHSWLEEDLNFAILKTLRRLDNESLAVLEGNITDEAIDKFFPAEFCNEKTIKRGDATYVTYTNPNWSPNVTQRWNGAFGIGDACVIPVLQNDIGFSLLSGMHVMSYVFGMMARYYPSTWISLQRVEKGDKILPFVHRIMDFIESRFPLQILDFLKSPYSFEKT